MDDAASKAADEAAKKAAEDQAALEESRFDNLGFREKYFSFGLPDTTSQQVQDEKWKFILLSYFLSSFFPDVWLPAAMWDPKPEIELSRLIMPMVIKYIIQVAGHIVIGFCSFFCPLYIGLYLWMPVHLVWYAINVWTSRMMVLQIWDDIVKYPSNPKKNCQDAGSAPLVAPAVPKT